MNGKDENSKDTDCVNVDVSIHIEEGIDPKEAGEYIQKLFSIVERLGESLHKERLTIGEALFVIYLLEKGALSVMNISDPEDIYHILAADNKSRTDMMTNIIIRQNAEKRKR